MEKIALHSFQLTDGCYERAPEDPQAKDSCKVNVDFHEQGKPDIPNSTVLLQRQRTRYVFDVQEAGVIPKLNEWGLSEENKDFQDKLRSVVQLNITLKKLIQTDGLSSNTALSSAGSRMIDFLVSGDLENPDELQKKNQTALLKDILTLPGASQKWLMDFHRIVKESPYSLAAMEPRLEWLSRQVKLFQDLSQVFESYPDEKTKEAFRAHSLRVVLSLHSGQEKPDTLEKDLNAFALSLSKTDPAAPDPFASSLKIFDALLKETLSKSGPDSRKNLVEWVRRLKIASNEHRFELYGLEPEAAFRRHLTYQIDEARTLGVLASKIEKELDYQGIPASDLKRHFERWAKALPSYLSFHKTVGTMPRVTLSTTSLLAEIRKGGTESKLAALATLRFLFGNDFQEATVDAWFNNKMTDLELELSASDEEKLKQLTLSVGPKNGGLNIPRDVILPIAHGAVMAGGIGLMSYGIVEKDEWEPRQNPFFHSGIGILGFGAGALTCNLAWKQKNAELQFLVDTLCGLAVGGTAAGLSFIPDNFGFIPTQPDDPLDNRNPNTPGGGGSCQPPDGGCGP